MTPTRGMHLFLAQTGYHALLALGMAEHLGRAGAGPSRLLAVEDFRGAAAFFEALRGWPESPFAEVVTLGAYDRFSGRRHKRASVRMLSDAVRAQVRDRAAVAGLYVFNDRNAFAQAALMETAQRHPTAARVAIEDGLGAYSSQRYRRYNRWRAFLHRWRFGPDWVNLEVLGTHPLVQRVLAHYPEALRPELAARPHARYPTDMLAALPLASFAQRLSDALRVDPAQWQAADVVVSVPGSYVFELNPDYAPRMRAIVVALAEAGLQVAIKYHPRDQAPDYLGVAGLANVQELPRAVQMEFVYLLLDSRRRVALGDVSNAFVLADKFNAGMRPLMFRHGGGFHEYDLADLMAKLRIGFVDDVTQLVAHAREWTRRP